MGGAGLLCTRKLCGLTIALMAAVLAAGLWPGEARAQGGANVALDWLRSRQNADGTWSRDARLAARDTAVVIETFEALDPSVSVTQPAVGALSALREQTVDLEARRLTALRRHVPEVVLLDALSDLAAARTIDTGWGVHRAYLNPESLDTALATRALVGTTALSVSTPFAILNKLAALQSADGGFGQAVGGESDVPTTTEVVRALTVLSQRGDVGFMRGPPCTDLFIVAAEGRRWLARGGRSGQ